MELELLLPAAFKAALKASEAVLKVYRSEFEVNDKPDRSPITEADRRSHRIITRELSRHARSGPFPVLSEEGRDISYSVRRNWKHFWLIDPLDGTKEFIKRNDEFTINIALIEENKPVLGVVYAPVFDLLYFGIKGIGSFLAEGVADGKTVRGILEGARKLARIPVIRFPSRSSEAGIRVACSRSHRSPEFEDFIEELKDSYREVELVPMGSALKMCLVAEGRADIYPRLGTTMEWDTAAAQAVLNEVGKRVYRFNSEEELVYNKRNLKNNWFIVR